MASRAVTTIKLTGPFFERDPAKTFRQNAKALTDAIAAEGEADVKAQLVAGQGGRLPLGRGLGRVSQHVVGRTQSLRGNDWQVTAVVSVNNRGLTPAQGVKLMAASSYLESQVHAFRKTKNRIGRSRKTNMAELLKGIA